MEMTLKVKNQKRQDLGEVRSYRMSPAAIAALDRLRLALDLPRSKILDLSVLRLEEDWRAGRVTGIALVESPPRDAKGSTN